MRISRNTKGQSSLELLITLAFGLIILLPIVVIAFVQIGTSTSSLASTEAQASASKLASIATSVGAQGAPAKQLTLIQVPQNVKAIYVGTTNSMVSIGHEVIFVINTNGGESYVTAYTPVNISGSLNDAVNPGSYLINVSAMNACPSDTSVACVYITKS
ncbi:MAG: hypothetical protein M1504_01650 [Candidatus Marsarchaeota archaeon]|nr:hypothetical protein [Candidatus Marsarchaeota archaeon]